MDKCETCGSVNENVFEIISNGVSHKFDTFDCAMSSLASECKNCGCLITGKKLEQSGGAYCCEKCVEQSFVKPTEAAQLATT